MLTLGWTQYHSSFGYFSSISLLFHSHSSPFFPWIPPSGARMQTMMMCWPMFFCFDCLFVCLFCAGRRGRVRRRRPRRRRGRPDGPDGIDRRQRRRGGPGRKHRRPFADSSLLFSFSTFRLWLFIFFLSMRKQSLGFLLFRVFLVDSSESSWVLWSNFGAVIDRWERRERRSIHRAVDGFDVHFIDAIHRRRDGLLLLLLLLLVHRICPNRPNAGRPIISRLLTAQWQPILFNYLRVNGPINWFSFFLSFFLYSQFVELNLDLDSSFVICFQCRLPLGYRVYRVLLTCGSSFLSKCSRPFHKVRRTRTQTPFSFLREENNKFGLRDGLMHQVLLGLLVFLRVGLTLVFSQIQSRGFFLSIRRRHQRKTTFPKKYVPHRVGDAIIKDDLCWNDINLFIFCTFDWQSLTVRDTVRDCLEKDPSERSDDDIEVRSAERNISFYVFVYPEESFWTERYREFCLEIEMTDIDFSTEIVGSRRWRRRCPGFSRRSVHLNDRSRMIEFNGNKKNRDDRCRHHVLWQGHVFPFKFQSIRRHGWRNKWRNKSQSKISCNWITSRSMSTSSTLTRTHVSNQVPVDSKTGMTK